MIEFKEKFEQVGDAFKDPLQEAMSLLDAQLEEVLKQDEEKAKVLLEAYKTAQASFVKENGAIDYEKLKDELEWDKKIMLLARSMLQDYLPGLAGLLSGESILPVSFEDEVKRIKESGQSALKMGHNLVYGKVIPGIWGNRYSLISALSQFSGKDEKGQDALRLIPGSTFVFPQKPAQKGFFGLDLPLRLRDELKAKGMEVRFFPNSAPDGALPGPNEIHIITLTPGVLPDRPVLERLQKVFDAAADKGAVQWYTPDVVAGILTLKGEDPKEAMKAVGLNHKTDAVLLASLENLKTKPNTNA